MRLLVTEVTEMHADAYCVAAWALDRKAMVRPLPGGRHWSRALIDARTVRPGRLLTVRPRGEPDGAYPHLTEDMPIDPVDIAATGDWPARWFGPDAPPTERSLTSAFGGRVRTTGIWDGAKKGAYVPQGAEVASLAAVETAPRGIRLFEHEYMGRRTLRAYLTLDDGTYNLPVTARNLRERYRAGGVAAAQALLPRAGRLHVRVGLARAFDEQPNKCTVMLNGVNV